LKIELGAPLDDITARAATNCAHQDWSEGPSLVIDAEICRKRRDIGVCELRRAIRPDDLDDNRVDFGRDGQVRVRRDHDLRSWRGAGREQKRCE